MRRHRIGVADAVRQHGGAAQIFSGYDVGVVAERRAERQARGGFHLDEQPARRPGNYAAVDGAAALASRHAHGGSALYRAGTAFNDDGRHAVRREPRRRRGERPRGQRRGKKAVHRTRPAARDGRAQARIMSEGDNARRYLRRFRHGVLSTLSKKFAGYPFGSVVPCVTDHAARPVILISGLAEHTKNIAADARVSLLVRDADIDPQEGARLTLIGDARPAGADGSAIQTRYLRFFPAAERLLALGDFAFFHIEPVALRYIGGFGAIHWITAASYAPPANTLAAIEEDIIAHMNADHAAALRDYCRHAGRQEPASISMVGIDCDGFDVRADAELLRFDFAQPV